MVYGYATTSGSDGLYPFTGIPVPGTDAGNLTVSPATQQVSADQPFTVTGTWTGLDPAQRHLGRIEYLQDGAPTGVFTVVTLTTGRQNATLYLVDGVLTPPAP